MFDDFHSFPVNTQNYLIPSELKHNQGWVAAEFQIGLIAAVHKAIPRPNMM